jgi:hypothetical protein
MNMYTRYVFYFLSFPFLSFTFPVHLFLVYSCIFPVKISCAISPRSSFPHLSRDSVLLYFHLNFCPLTFFPCFECAESCGRNLLNLSIIHRTNRFIDSCACSMQDHTSFSQTNTNVVRYISPNLFIPFFHVFLFYIAPLFLSWSVPFRSNNPIIHFLWRGSHSSARWQAVYSRVEVTLLLPFFSSFLRHCYCTFSFKSTGGVTRDPFYLFDISAAAEFLHDTPKISSFLNFLSSFGTCMTA